MSHKVNFVGFEPSHELLSKAKNMIWRVEEQSPSQSSHRAIISKTSCGDFIGNLKVAWQGGSFEINSDTNLSPEDTLKSLLNQMHSNINTWKSSIV